MRIARLALLILVVVTSLVGCAPSKPTEQDAVHSTILRYNELLSEGYRSLNMNGVAQVATKLQAEDEYIHMSSLAEGGVRLDPDLKDIKFVKVSVETTTALVETS